MEGAVRLFAGEFCQASLSVPGEDDRSAAWVVTPSGAWCRQVFLAGALTEVHEDGDMVSARLADPTGGFDLSCGGRSTPAAEAVRKIPQPSFVSVTGRVQSWKKAGTLHLSVRPEQVCVIDRTVRDQWVLATARATLCRLKIARLVLLGEFTDERLAACLRYYGMTPARLDDLATIVESAVLNVKPSDAPSADQPDARERILELLKANPGPRGMAVQDIIDTLAGDGIFQDAVLAAIQELIVEDECYQPQKGNIRLL